MLTTVSLACLKTVFLPTENTTCPFLSYNTQAGVKMLFLKRMASTKKEGEVILPVVFKLH